MGLMNDLLTLWISSQGTCAHVEEGVSFFVYDRPTEEWDKTRANIVAFLLGTSVLVRSKEDLTPKIIKHELTHARQMRKYGGELVYRPLYLLGMLKAKITTGDADNHVFEQEALESENN